MNWKFITIITVPLMFFGCTTLHFFYGAKKADALKSIQQPEQREVLDFGPKIEDGSAR